MKKGQATTYIIIAIVVIVALGTLFLFIQPSLTGNVVANTNSLGGNSEKNCRDVQIPYDVTEEYIDPEEYQGFEDVQVNLKYEKNGYSRESYSELFNVRYKGIVNVKNVDSETGYFKVKMYFKTLEDGTTEEQTGGYIQPSETKEFNIYYDIDSGEDVEWSYEVIPGQKTVTKPVTKYRDVPKTRTVTKYKTEQVCD